MVSIAIFYSESILIKSTCSALVYSLSSLNSVCRYCRACKNYAAFHNGKLLRGNEQWGLLSGWIVSNQIHIWRWIVEYFPPILESPWVSYFSLVNTWERKRWWTPILFLFYLIETLPTGYAFDAIDRAKVHRLKVPPHAMGETCFDKVYEDMLGFLKENYTPQFDENSRELPMAIFTHDIHMKMIKSILSQLPQRPDDVQNDVDVLSLNMLFNQLKNIDAPDANTRISIHVSNMLMDADRYDAASNIACNYHEENDGALQCAMSICRRWFYTFCDHVCAKLGVTLVSGVHLPDNSDCNRKRRGGDSKKNRSGCSRSSEWIPWNIDYWLLLGMNHPNRERSNFTNLLKSLNPYLIYLMCALSHFRFARFSIYLLKMKTNKNVKLNPGYLIQ